MIKSAVFLSLFLLSVAGCNTDSQSHRTLGAAIGAGGGALIGAAASGGRGAAVGALAGGAAGALIGRATTPNNCVFEDRSGRRFTGRCP
jgi:uncharacterized protein YcfJ